MTGALAPALQTFVTDSYGPDVWNSILHDSHASVDTFEVMLSYDGSVASSVLTATAKKLKRAPSEILEDLGIYLVAHDNTKPIRRLLRFGGVDFEGFLETLGDLPDRARLALPHVVLPALTVEEVATGEWIVWCDRKPDGLVHLMLGAIRAMADEYGALVLANLVDDPSQTRCRIDVLISAHSHSEGRAFEIGQGKAV
ncbi:Heme NO binding protein [Rhodobacteraceae bacterium THAF1]|uniref:heme NO-binding domain-containing protein n=1 Tax=Palleronia sp. THAF1 TaxID=2587842 RepID=UPI000F403FA1|nr:heme NO-binding domain-containing protein [Palleronia sp. THAF1]QFU08114.1 Heme NO binding protein [Palleronia sp. THAF1]VDC27981.1 Heme NO binding protein [Rhodobacteraceae bacterium THAF1]